MQPTAAGLKSRCGLAFIPSRPGNRLFRIPKTSVCGKGFSGRTTQLAEPAAQLAEKPANSIVTEPANSIAEPADNLQNQPKKQSFLSAQVGLRTPIQFAAAGLQSQFRDSGASIALP
jgi:hypothetical protein